LFNKLSLYSIVYISVCVISNPGCSLSVRRELSLLVVYAPVESQPSHISHKNPAPFFSTQLLFFELHNLKQQYLKEQKNKTVGAKSYGNSLKLKYV